MAIYNDYRGEEDRAPGRWIPYRTDPDSGLIAEVRVRPLNRKVVQDIQSKFEEPITIEVKGKARTQLGVPKDKQEEYGNELLCWMFREVRNFVIGVWTKQAADFYSKETNVRLEIGQELDLGKYTLTDLMKVWLITDMPDLLNLIMTHTRTKLTDFEIEIDEDVKQRLREEALANNLATGSPSSSGTAGSQKTASGVETAVSESPEEVESRASTKTRSRSSRKPSNDPVPA